MLSDTLSLFPQGEKHYMEFWRFIDRASQYIYLSI